MTRLASSFAEKVSPSIDIRFQLFYNFGTYLAEVPRRLGTNAALDAAAESLVSAYAFYCSGALTAGYHPLSKYNNAISALRHILDDPVRATSSETLCAIMMLMSVPVLMRMTDGVTANHMEGASRVLKCRGYIPPRDEFEKLLMLSLRGPVVIEALCYDKVDFTRQEWQDLVQSGLENLGSDIKWLSLLSRIPELYRRCRAEWQSPNFTEENLVGLRYEVHICLQEIRDAAVKLRERLVSSKQLVLPVLTANFIDAHLLRTLALTLLTGIVLNCILKTAGEESEPTKEEASGWSAEILRLAEASIPYQPLASLTMLFCLYAAWSSTEDPTLRHSIQVLLQDYEMACLGRKTENMVECLELTRDRFLPTYGNRANSDRPTILLNYG
ncbi:hypothetical protein MMC25_003229 [Agyrium rufum]|nr:hypothetical protein [Agyrium rufum]